MDQYHVPVMPAEALEMLNIRPDGHYADLTFGGGGHSRLILSRLGPDGRLYGFDQDADARGNIPDDPRFVFVAGNFRFMRSHLRALGVEALDGVLADLGVSSHHFDTPERGFSFRFDAPLDMRMNQRGGVSAADIVAAYDVDELARVFGRWGEVERPYKVAQCVIRARDAAPVATVGALIEATAPCTPRKDAAKFHSRLFQSLRIETNREMEALEMALEQSLRILKPGGRMVTIAYHSLEDRMIKNFFRSGNFDGEFKKDFYGNVQTPWEVVTRKALAPTPEEVEANPRSRSAHLRAAIKR